VAAYVRIPLSTLDSDGRAVVEVNGRDIAVFVVDGAVYALDNRCPHEGNPLVEGEMLGPTLTCAYHGWRFDLETGACLHGDEPLRRYPGEIRDGEIVISVDG
jgi:nitrite reductase/ring-hydroxylating ferredoxin subunit